MTATRPYHHGGLRAALIREAQAVIAERGASALTLRECARRIGVSHAAPKHHFADKTAMLAAVAAQGYRDMAADMDRARDRAPADPRVRLRAVGMAYIRFAMDNPGTFHLMFGEQAVAHEDPDLNAAADDAFARLTHVIAELERARGHDPESPEAIQRRMLAWTAVHGFATLWLTGGLRREFGVSGNPDEALAAAERFLNTTGPGVPPARA